MIKPYYQEANITLYCGDCSEILPELEEKPDLILTSPPYDDLRLYGGHSFDYTKVIDAISLALKDNGVCVWIVNDQVINGSETGTSFRQALYFMGKGLKLHDTMIYVKNGFSHIPKKRYNNVFEYMFVFVKGKVTKFNSINIQSRWADTFKYTTFRQRDGSVVAKNVHINKEFPVSNIWYFDVGYMKTTKDKLAYKHPAIFPDDLAYSHIYSWTNEGDLVCDPMCGSGTVLIQAKVLKRKAIGIEINEDYCKIIVERLKNTSLLF